MGGCNCKKSELDAEQSNTLGKTGDNSIKEEPSLKITPKKSDQIEKEKLSKLIQQYGTSISESEFSDTLPVEYRDYMSQNPLEEDNENPSETEDLIQFDPVRLQNGNLYWGYWNGEGEMSGKGKYYLTEDKAFVEGIWINGILKKGRIMSMEGIYEGEIENNLFQGIGKMRYPGDLIYEGDWVQGKREGHGKLTWSDGTIYIGEFKDDIIEGKGEFKWSNGYYYNGEFVNNIFEGNGLLKADNGSEYEGEFKNGKFNGEGKFFWGGNAQNKNGDEDIEGNEEKEHKRYQGNYLNGKKDGNGKYFFDNENYYEGEWKDNVPHGQGTLFYDNEFYKCVWKKGKVVENLNKDYSSIENILNFKAEVEDIDLEKCLYLELSNTSQNDGTNNKNIVPKDSFFASMFK